MNLDENVLYSNETVWGRQWLESDTGTHEMLHKTKQQSSVRMTPVSYIEKKIEPCFDPHPSVVQAHQLLRPN